MSTPIPTNYVVPSANLQKVLNYLASRPFAEVAALIPLIQEPQITAVPEVATDEEVK